MVSRGRRLGRVVVIVLWRDAQRTIWVCFFYRYVVVLGERNRVGPVTQRAEREWIHMPPSTDSAGRHLELPAGSAICGCVGLEPALFCSLEASILINDELSPGTRKGCLVQVMVCLVGIGERLPRRVASLSAADSSSKLPSTLHYLSTGRSSHT